MTGPLDGVRIVELAGIGPGPFAGMMLADHGATVIQIERPDRPPSFHNVLHRSRRSIAVDLKTLEGVAVVRRLCAGADGLIEGFRPGVMERLGLGPDVLLKDNPALVYGRMTGWGQSGPLSQAAGHDLNYIALSGALHMMGRADQKPPVPLNLIGDFGAGGMMLAFGMVSAILSARTTGRGQVVDAAMSDGTAVLMSLFFSQTGAAGWPGQRGENMLGGAAPFYDTYETADGNFIALSALEPQFYAELIQRIGLADEPAFADQNDRSRWPEARTLLTRRFLERTREEWRETLEGRDVCFAPVLSLAEAPDHPHNLARETFLTVDGHVQPAPAPRFSASPPPAPQMPVPGGDTDTVLVEAGFSSDEIARLRKTGVVAGPLELAPSRYS